MATLLSLLLRGYLSMQLRASNCQLRYGQFTLCRACKIGDTIQVELTCKQKPQKHLTIQRKTARCGGLGH